MGQVERGAKHLDQKFLKTEGVLGLDKGKGGVFNYPAGKSGLTVAEMKVRSVCAAKRQRKLLPKKHSDRPAQRGHPRIAL